MPSSINARKCFSTQNGYDYDCDLQLHADMHKICASIIADHASVLYLTIIPCLNMFDVKPGLFILSILTLL
jgi:deoxycytidylate deaminase